MILRLKNYCNDLLNFLNLLMVYMILYPLENINFSLFNERFK